MHIRTLSFQKNRANLSLQWTAAMEPGANPPVDDFPILSYVPSKLAFWKGRALDAGRTMDSTWSEARRRVEERRATGVRRNCIIDNLLDDYESKGWPQSISQHAFTNLMGEMIEGGADTTSAQLLTLILAFALNPHVQEKARKEIDAVCGTLRSPLWTDFASLPYINCIIKEGMRWRPIYVQEINKAASTSKLIVDCRAVTGLPHRVRQGTCYDS